MPQDAAKVPIAVIQHLTTLEFVMLPPQWNPDFRHATYITAVKGIFHLALICCDAALCFELACNVPSGSPNLAELEGLCAFKLPAQSISSQALYFSSLMVISGHASKQTDIGPICVAL